MQFRGQVLTVRLLELYDGYSNEHHTGYVLSKILKNQVASFCQTLSYHNTKKQLKPSTFLFHLIFWILIIKPNEWDTKLNQKFPSLQVRLHRIL